MHDLFWFVADSLRYDHLGAITSAILGWKGVRFERAFAVATTSDPNFAALLTGLMPWESGILSQADWDAPPPAAPTVFEELKAQGWATAALGFPNASGFYRAGVDRYEEVYIEGESYDALKLIAGTPSPRAILIRAAECHAPYYGGSYYQACQAIDHVFHACLRLFDPDKTVAIFQSDHGEGLGEHGVMEHSGLPWECLIHVPLIMSWPGCPAGYTSYELVSHVSVHNAIRSLSLGAPSDSSLLKAAHGRPSGLEVTRVGGVASYEGHIMRYYALRGPRWKRMWEWNDTGGKSWFFDLWNDPGELTDLLRVAEDYSEPPPAGLRSAYSEDEAREIEDKLHAVGYLD